MHLTLATGYRYVSSYWSDPLIDEARIESFTLWDLQARYKRPNWSLDLFIRNANNERNLDQVTELRDTDVLRSGRINPGAQPIGLSRYSIAAPGRLTGLRLSLYLGGK